MKCSKCGRDVQDGFIYCPMCGTRAVGEDDFDIEDIIDVDMSTIPEKHKKRVRNLLILLTILVCIVLVCAIIK